MRNGEEREGWGGDGRGGEKGQKGGERGGGKGSGGREEEKGVDDQ